MNKKNLKKIVVLASVGLVLIVVGFLSWEFYFSKQLIFKNQEKEFLEVVERYYSMNKQYLPKKGETREVVLQFLYDGNHLSDLYIPKTKELCDSNGSWVRVYNNNGQYEYTTYLKCGKYESKVDHTGPEVVLNGGNTQVISIGSDYEELGVKSVIDKVDGPINVSSVIIDSSKVNTSKIGSYEVTYTISDKAYNKTVVTRVVNVAYNLTDVVKNATDDSNYYKGVNVNNYLQFSGMLWRIVNVNEDGSVRIVSDKAVTNLRSDYEQYKDSNIDKWLNNYFYSKLNENSKKYLQNSNYCVGNTISTNDLNGFCSESLNLSIGLLNTKDFLNSFIGNDSYLCDNSFYLLGGKINNNGVVASCSSKEKVQTITEGSIPSIRVSLTLKPNLYMMVGTGEQQNPYKLDDYNYAKVNDKISTRLIGEYVVYSGITFRIIGFDSDMNAKVIMSEPWKNISTGELLKVTVSNLENYIFNVTDEGNPGYILNNEFIEYIDDSKLVDGSFDIPTNISNKLYDDYSKTTIYTKIGLPTTYELFSTAADTSVARNELYLYSDKSSNGQMVFMLNGANGMMFELGKTDFYSYAVRPVMYLKNDLKVVSGRGTLLDPYYMK